MQPTTISQPPQATRQTPRVSAPLILAALVGVLALEAIMMFVVLPAASTSWTSQYSMGFADLYDYIGNNIALGVGYRVEPDTTVTMIREPGYPLFLAGVFAIGGYSIEAARVANLLLAAGIALMVLKLAETISGDRVIALVSALLFLLYPSILVSEARGGIEIPFVFVVMVFMLALHRAAAGGERWRYLLAGALLGVVVLFRGTPLLFPVVLVGCLALVARTGAERVRAIVNVAVLVVGMIIVMTPWLARNYVLSGRIVPTATVQGIAAQEGQLTCERAGTRDFWQLQDEASAARNEVATELGLRFKGPYYQIFYSPQDEMAFNDELLRVVGTKYREEPWLLPRCVARNLFFNFWFLGRSSQATLLNAVVQVPLLALALGGVWILWRRRELHGIAIIVGFSGYIVAIHSPIIAHARHSVPLVPFLSILASISLVTTWRSWRARKSAR